MTTTDPNAGLFSMTAPAPMIWVNLHVARKYKDAKTGKEKGEPKFGATFLLTPDHPDFAGLKAKAAAVARAMWPDGDFAGITFPFKSGDKYVAQRETAGKPSQKEIFGGKILLKGASMFPIALSATVNGKFTEFEGEAKEANKPLFYSGVLALAEFNFVAYDLETRSVTAYLGKVYSTNKGTRIGGGRSAAEAFKGYLGHASSENPTLGDDEIPY